VALAAPVEAIEKSGPVPVNATTCGLPVALSVMEIEALRVPIPVGVKLTRIWQLAPTATEEPQVLVCAKSPAFAPAIATPVTVKVIVPVFVS
jgi:hypothetical protein